MDEKASRCFICCKCSVCMCMVLCVCACMRTLLCEAYHVPNMQLCSVRGLFSLSVPQIRSHFTAQVESYYSFPVYPFICSLCQSCLKGIVCFRPPGYGEPPEIPLCFSLTLLYQDWELVQLCKGWSTKKERKENGFILLTPLLKTFDPHCLIRLKAKGTQSSTYLSSFYSHFIFTCFLCSS